MAQLNLSLPSFQGMDLSDEKQLRKLTSYLYRLDEQLRYVLNNLGEENLSDSLRAIINAQTDATVLDELTGRLQRLNTKIIQTAESIKLTASKEDLDALEKSVTELTVTAGEIRLAVEKKLDADAPSVGVETASAVVNEKGVYLTGGEIDMRTTDGEDFVNITDSGVEASSLRAPDVMPRYDGPESIYVKPDATAEEIAAGGTYRSLKEALEALSGRMIDGYVLVQLASGMTEYGSAVLKGAVIGGQVSIAGDYASHATVVGRLSVENCMGTVSIGHVDVQAQLETPGILISGAGAYAAISGCVITGGDGSGNAVEVSQGARAHVSGCEMYYCPYAVMARNTALVAAQGNKGNCQYAVNAGVMFATGTVPCNQSELTYTAMGAGQVFTTPGMAVDQGSAGGSTPGVPVIATQTYDAVNVTSYEADGSVWSAEYAIQGWWKGAGRIMGCMWFDHAALQSDLSGKTVLTAMLRLSMKSSGRGTAVTVELAGTDANAGGSPEVTKTYGAIATMSPGETMNVTLPMQAVNDLKEDEIRGLMLYSGDTVPHKEREYSKNYAAFYGTAGGEDSAPMLTITYEG